MRMPIRKVSSWLALLLLFLGGAACRTMHHQHGHTGFKGASVDDVIKEIDEVKTGTDGAKDVLLVAVFSNGKVIPKLSILQAENHAIVWYTVDSTELMVVQKSDEYETPGRKLPDYPKVITCKPGKGICSTRRFPKLSSGDPFLFGYSGSVGAAKTPLDPRIEIVN